MVRVHLRDMRESLEGIYAGRMNGHYRLLNPKTIEAEGGTMSLEGEVWIPRTNVIFLQRL